MKKVLLISFIVLLFINCKKTDLSKLNDFFTLRNKGADMPVWVEGNAGNKKFIITVHGGPGGDGQVYNTLMKDYSDKMESNFGMVYWDQRGSGNSSGKYDNGTFNLETFVDDLDKLIDVLKLRYGQDIKIYIMGHSWGGTMVTAYAIDAQRQQKIAGMIEVDGAHNFNDQGPIVRTFNAIGKEQIAKGNQVDNWNTILTFCNSLDTNHVSDADYGTLNSYGFEAESYVDDVVNNSGAEDIFKYLFGSSYSPITAKINETITNYEMNAGLTNLNLTSKLKDIKIPSLFAWGKYDMVVPMVLGKEAFSACGASDKKLIIFEHSGHSPMSNEMQEFSDAIINWVKEH